MKHLASILFLLVLFSFEGKSQVPGSEPKVVINEFSHKHPAGNRMDFIELKNNDTVAHDMANFIVFLVDQDLIAYNQIQSPVMFGMLPPGGHYVLGSTDGVPNPDVTPFSETFENIVSDTGAIALLHVDFGPIDLVSYGEQVPVNFEGDAISVLDSLTGFYSFSRIEDGLDTDNNDNDFQLVCMTPGSENVLDVACSVNSQLKINEIDLTGDSILIEIFNPAGEESVLDGFTISSTTDALAGFSYYNLFGTIAAGGYRVFNIGLNSSSEVHYGLVLPGGSSSIGSPSNVIDNFTIGVLLTDIPTPEGSVSGDDSSAVYNYSRIPNGVDTDNNSSDFQYV